MKGIRAFAAAFYNRYFVKIDGPVATNYKKVAPNPACIIDSRFTLCYSNM